MKRRLRIFAVDGPWYLWRAVSTLKSNRPMEEVLPYNLLAMVMKDALTVKATNVIVAFDGPRIFRYKIYPDYKANRTGRGHSDGLTDSENAESGESIRDQAYAALPHIYALFDSVGVAFFQPKTFEADDVLASIAHACLENEGYAGYDLVCGTQDKDGYQYLRDGVRLADPSAKGKDGKPKLKYITAEVAEKKKGVKIAQMVDLQTLIGDKGDNIMPLPDMDLRRAKKVLAEFGSIRNWYKKDKDAKTYLTANQERLRLNRKLVTLVTEALPPGDPSSWKLLKTKPDNKYLKQSYFDYHNWLYPKTKGLFR